MLAVHLRSRLSADVPFDVLVFHTVLCHVPEPEVAIGEAHRVLRAQGCLAVFDGDYATATESCATDNETGTTVVVSGTPEPPSGDGYWYLVRGVNCKGKGTFNSGGAMQVGLRDAEIAASGNDCP